MRRDAEHSLRGSVSPDPTRHTAGPQRSIRARGTDSGAYTLGRGAPLPLPVRLYGELSLHLSAALDGPRDHARSRSASPIVRTQDPKWRQLAFFWTQIYGLIFALGVATGVVQEFEFGMNWANYSRFVGNVFGSLLAAEGIFAFFLEGGFLGLMLFGGNRLGPRMWLGATTVVVFAAHFSAIWIVMANSWMQTPDGYELVTSGGTNASAHDR